MLTGLLFLYEWDSTKIISVLYNFQIKIAHFFENLNEEYYQLQKSCYYLRNDTHKLFFQWRHVYIDFEFLFDQC